eukprot:6359179-Prymnesium_polylepis.1
MQRWRKWGADQFGRVFGKNECAHAHARTLTGTHARRRRPVRSLHAPRHLSRQPAHAPDAPHGQDWGPQTRPAVWPVEPPARHGRHVEQKV